MIGPWEGDGEDSTGIGIVDDIVREVGRKEEAFEDAAREEVSADVGFLCLCCVEVVEEMVDLEDVEGARRGEVGLRVDRRELGEVE